MLVQIRSLFRYRRQVVIRILVGMHRASIEEQDGFIEHARVSGARDIAAHRQRKPEVVVRTMSAHAAAGGRMPPMLHIAFAKLARSAQQKMFSREPWLGVDQRHDILQLITETESSAGLVTSTPCPKTAREGLVQQPAVGQ